MKIFYFGSVCADEIFNKTVEQSKVKPSASAQNFESALIKGFSQIENLEVTAASAESIAMYPGGNRVILKSRTDKLTENINTNILFAINLPLIKQIMHAKSCTKVLKKWLKENSDSKDKCVLCYGIYPAVVKRIQALCTKNKCKCFAVITDVPSTMFTYTKSKNLLKRLFSGSYKKSAIALQDKFDGYIYLTENMKGEVAPEKPYTVVETIADTSIFDNIKIESKATPPALMYAGALYKKYGVDLIIDVFEKIKTDCQLWLFGSGDYENEIIARASKNDKIKFFGRVSRQEVLLREQQASLLLNIRNSDDEYTKYSFPSKMVEYMLSATPLITTRLEGIPCEYYNYCYALKERDAEKIAAEIDVVLNDKNLEQTGQNAKEFVKQNKNAFCQAKKIVEFANKNL